MQKKVTNDYFVNKNKRPPSQQMKFMENEKLMNPRKNKKMDENKSQLPISPPVVKIPKLYFYSFVKN